jgi:Spy/CpxP family protein refolding chaperone
MNTRIIEKMLGAAAALALLAPIAVSPAAAQTTYGAHHQTIYGSSGRAYGNTGKYTYEGTSLGHSHPGRFGPQPTNLKHPHNS